jgi:hypothetical protein
LSSIPVIDGAASSNENAARVASAMQSVVS